MNIIKNIKAFDKCIFTQGNCLLNHLWIEMQRNIGSGCHQQKNSMRGYAIVFIVTIFTILTFACKKEGLGKESYLYGVWIKGSNTGDTWWFMKKNGKSIIRVPDSFNPQMAIYSEKEYHYINGVLSIQSFAPFSDDYYPVTTFNWIEAGKEFSIQNTELFLFMSSITTYKYKKI